MSEPLCKYCDSGLPGDICTCLGGTEGKRPSARLTLDAHEVAASIERNNRALLFEVAPHALRGLGLAIFDASNEPAHSGDRCAELCALKAKFEAWILSNR
jgi:hypothetical protein